MKTDQVIYQFLSTGPEAFRVLTAGLTLVGDYTFGSLTFKAVERRIDLAFWFFERFRTLTADEIWTMLQRLTPLEETRAYQSIFVKGEAKGKAEGKAEGTAEGKAEGKAEGLKRLLARRFGPLPPWAEARIASAPITRLDDWIDGLLDADSLTALIGPQPGPESAN